MTRLVQVLLLGAAGLAGAPTGVPAATPAATRAAAAAPDVLVAAYHREAQASLAAGEPSRAAELLGHARDRAAEVDAPLAQRAGLAHQEGVAHRAAGELEGAEASLKGALTLHQEAGDDFQLARVMNDLALTYQDQGDAVRAEALARRALDLGSRARGAASPATAALLLNLSRLLSGTPRAGRVAPDLERFLDAWISGPTNADPVPFLQALQTVLPGREGALRVAGAARRVARAWSEARPEDRDVWRVRNQLGAALESAGDGPGAARVFGEALAGLEGLEVPEAKAAALAQVRAALANNQASAYLLADQGAKAREALTKVEALRPRLGDAHPQVIRGLALAARERRGAGELEAAAKNYRKAWELLQKGGIQSPEIQAEYAALLRELGREQEAARIAPAQEVAEPAPAPQQ